MSHLLPQKRLAEHVRQCCSNWSSKERLDAIDTEHKRGKELYVVSYTVEELPRHSHCSGQHSEKSVAIRELNLGSGVCM